PADARDRSGPGGPFDRPAPPLQSFPPWRGDGPPRTARRPQPPRLPAPPGERLGPGRSESLRPEAPLTNLPLPVGAALAGTSRRGGGAKLHPKPLSGAYRFASLVHWDRAALAASAAARSSRASARWA